MQVYWRPPGHLCFDPNQRFGETLADDVQSFQRSLCGVALILRINLQDLIGTSISIISSYYFRRSVRFVTIKKLLLSNCNKLLLVTCIKLPICRKVFVFLDFYIIKEYNYNELQNINHNVSKVYYNHFISGIYY